MSLDAKKFADILVDADLRGVASHGVRKLPNYLKQLQNKNVDFRRQARIISQNPNSIMMDGRNCVGHLSGHVLCEKIVTLLRSNSIAVGTVRNTGHVGTLGYYVRMLSSLGYVAIAVSNGPTKSMFARGGSKHVLGTNPIAAGFPKADGNPLVIDFASAHTSLNGIRVAAANKESISEESGLDKNGNPTSNPQEVVDGGSPAWVGGTGSHKGFALAVMIEALAGALSGSVTSSDLPESTKNGDGKNSTGLTIIAIAPGKMGQLTGFSDSIQAMCKGIRLSSSTGVEVTLPGDPETAAFTKNSFDGIPIDSDLLAELKELDKASSKEKERHLRAV